MNSVVNGQITFFQACPTDGYIRGHPRISADGRIRMVDLKTLTDTDGYGYFVYPSADIRINLHWIKFSQKDKKMVKILNEFSSITAIINQIFSLFFNVGQKLKFFVKSKKLTKKIQGLTLNYSKPKKEIKFI